VDAAEAHEGETPQPIREGEAARFPPEATQEGARGVGGLDAAHGGPMQQESLDCQSCGGLGTETDCRAWDPSSGAA
jgi:hypothetical protein